MNTKFVVCILLGISLIVGVSCKKETPVSSGPITGGTGAIAFYRKLGFVTVGKRTFRVGKMSSEGTVFALTL